jgi:baseplate hub protein gp41
VPQSLDLRVIKVGIEVDGQLKVYQSPLGIYAKGTKYANSLQNECEVKLLNLDRDTLDYILTETSPFNLNRTPKIITVDAGRESYGTTRIFTGNIVTAKPTQPPDVALTIKALTGNYSKGNIVSRSQGGMAQLSTISQQVATDLGVGLNFQATDKQIGNYTYSGAALKQVDKLNDTGQVTAYIDDGTLVVKNLNLPLPNVVTIVNLETGMVEIPELTEQGIKVKFYLDGQTQLGGLLRVTSDRYPAANGDYVIYKLGFDIATREKQFFWIAEGKRLS